MTKTEILSYTGLTPDARAILLKAFNANQSTTDKELLLSFSNALTGQTDENQHFEGLKRERATLVVNKYAADALINPNEKELYIKLATSSFEQTVDILEGMKFNETNKNEIEALLTLSDDELYHSDGKLERLKALSPAEFKLRFKRIFGIEYQY